MSECINICPIGAVREDILFQIARSINIRSRILCNIISDIEAPDYAYNITRRQYNAKMILQNLIKCCPPNTLKFVGITDVDLYIPILKFVYGLTQIQGKCCIISTHRLLPQFYGYPNDQDLFMSRLEKTVLHELGHSFGLTHCRNRSCVMYSSTRIDDTDFKNPYFCPTCLELLKWYIERSS